MNGKIPERRLPLGQPPAELPARVALAEWLGAAVTVVWAVLVLVWGLGLGNSAGLGGMLFLAFAVGLPLVMLGLVVLLIRSVRDLRGDAAQLRAQIVMLKQAEAREAANRAVRDEAGTAALPAAALSNGPGFMTRRAAPEPVAPPPPTVLPPDEQPALALTAPEEDSGPPSVEDFIRAIQFPESNDDVEGFAALRRVLGDRTSARLIRASQDVLSLLAKDGIYMDELQPDRARPDLWRRFAAGERGRAVAALGGVRDRSCLALTGQKMREDAIFRDAAHHFLRSFDRAFATIEPLADDAEIARLADTRTARAFMLVGRVAGTFD